MAEGSRPGSRSRRSIVPRSKKRRTGREASNRHAARGSRFASRSHAASLRCRPSAATNATPCRPGGRSVHATSARSLLTPEQGQLARRSRCWRGSSRPPVVDREPGGSSRHRSVVVVVFFWRVIVVVVDVGRVVVVVLVV